MTRTANTPAGWLDAIGSHISDPVASAAQGNELRMQVQKEWMLDEHALIVWREAWVAR
ncbi:hypothetical protein [Pseudomonas sp. REB1044]|uniref:hypothetical protein n=1 Tax=Pseudomonas sp. REB1044 TaxID=2675224 RepID=UPI00315DD347